MEPKTQSASLTTISQSGETAAEQTMHELRARRLADGRIELWITESRLKKYPGRGRKAKWHSESAIMMLSPENAAKLSPVFCA